MPITSSNTFQGTDYFSTELIAATTATVLSINHNLGAIKAAAGTGIGGLAPQDVTLTPLGNDFYLSRWFIRTVNTTLVTVVKATTSLSGGAGVQAKLIVRRPHSIGR